MYFSEDECIAKKLQNDLNSTRCYDSSFNQKENTEPSDPDLELSDPTPSIYNLFVNFDKKFFWGALGMVQVLWSNRMTKCAGMCYFEGNQGLCKISLSAPLLSFRPRKDLVETLLHEMIHAYLFVTNNYKDRNDHGTEFHKHMFRINREAGTNITVYHTFHDEVAYYQQHIWRCNGACRFKKPYFGFVKRSMNRAPGPNDFWWNQHKIECNGTFIKISEPEKKNKKTTETRAIKSVVKSKDIRDFFKHSGEVDFDTSNITTLTDLNLSLKVTKSEFKSLSVIKKNKAKIFNLKKSSSSEKKSDQQGKALSKGKGKIQGKTLLKSQEKCLIPVAQLNFDKDKSLSNGTFCKSINATTNAKSGSVENVQEVVRNVWSKKFLSVVDDISPDTKKMKIDCCEKQFSEKKEKSNYSCEAVEEIIDCTEKPKMCPVCNELIIVELKDHLESCVPPAFRSQNDDEKSRNKYDYDFLPCPCCYKCFHESEMNSHIDECLTMIALKEEMLSF